MDEYEKEAIMDLIGFFERSMPFRYSGVPLSGVYLKVADFTPLLNKVSSTLLTWVGLNLSYAGRLEVISSVIQGVESFCLRVLPISAAILDRITTIDALVEKEGSIVEATNQVDSWVVDDTLNTSLAYDTSKGQRIWRSIKEWSQDPDRDQIVCKIKIQIKKKLMNLKLKNFTRCWVLNSRRRYTLESKLDVRVQYE
ncbi:hypothetical protein M9H77_18182 [Catharanthus roseus]|uniref:Uncharacterized protein n=1 Tax=Catharanthus roseus TaxID=4058 RepID=A0ACC0B6Q4_CATRO|nr:hypothetical protein M9H77_18182 [Catharanthus roseus]